MGAGDIMVDRIEKKIPCFPKAYVPRGKIHIILYNVHYDKKYFRSRT